MLNKIIDEGKGLLNMLKEYYVTLSSFGKVVFIFICCVCEITPLPNVITFSPLIWFVNYQMRNMNNEVKK